MTGTGQAHQLAADQASRRVRGRSERRRDSGRGPLRRVRPHHGRDRRGQGPRAEAFMLRRPATPPSRCGLGQRDAGLRRRTPSAALSQRRTSRRSHAADHAGFHRAAALRDASSVRRRARAGCTRSSSTATASRCACRRRGHVEDPQGAGLDGKFGAIAQAAAALPDAIIDGEIVALDRKWRAGFRRASGGLVGGQDRRPGLLRLRSAVRRRRGSARRCR